MIARTDRNNNPAAFTTDVAKVGGLVEGVDYEKGDPFQTSTGTLFTAKLLGDPIELTIKVIDKATYYTKTGKPRWSYIAIPSFIWNGLLHEDKIKVVAFHYRNEGGNLMSSLFASPQS